MDQQKLDAYLDLNRRLWEIQVEERRLRALRSHVEAQIETAKIALEAGDDVGQRAEPEPLVAAPIQPVVAKSTVSMPDRVRSVLNSRIGQIVTITAMADELHLTSTDDLRLLRSTMSRLAGTGEFENCGRGKYKKNA